MAEYTDPDERTELPTGKRMGDLRKKGQIFLSHEVTLVTSLVTSFLMLGVIWPMLYQGLKDIFALTFQAMASREPLTYLVVQRGLLASIYILGPAMMLLMAVTAFFASMSVFLQTGFNIKERKIHFQFNLLSPLNGIKRIFSIGNFVQVLKSIAKLILILPIAYFALKPEATKMIQLVHMSIPTVMSFIAKEIDTLFWKITYILIAIAIFDWTWGRYQWFRHNKMTKEEVKDEKKSTEGDETTKRKIIAKGLERIMKRLMSTVPKADVIVTNPTHYAVALQYTRNSMSAPKVVAKGKNFLAHRIKEIAREHNIPIVERKSLARALYHSVEVDQEIPYELYKATAEVLAYVFKLGRKKVTQSQEARV